MTRRPLQPLCLTINRSEINPGQWKFLNSTAPVVLLSGGFGSGKTTGLSLKFLQLKFENGAVPGLVVSQTYKSLWSTTYPRLMKTMKRTLPQEHMPKIKDRLGACYLEFPDGGQVFLRSATNPEGLDGLDVGWVLMDELRHYSEKAYNIILGRMRVRCPRPQAGAASTPEMHWMAEDFYFKKSKLRELIIAPTLENAHNLAPHYIDNLRQSYSPRLQKAVIDGFFTVLEGAVYDALDPDFWSSPWVTSMTDEEILDSKIYLAVDPGFRRSSWLYIAERGPRDWVVFDQMQLESTTDASAIQYIHDRPWPIDEVWCDPAGDNTQSTLGLDTLDMLRAIPLRSGRSQVHVLTNPFRGVAFGVDKVRALLGDPEKGLVTRLRFDRRLQANEATSQRGIVKDLLSYKYPELKYGRPVSNEPLKDGQTDHSNDSLRYWAVGRFLADPFLRTLDPQIANMASDNRTIGYKVT